MLLKRDQFLSNPKVCFHLNGGVDKHLFLFRDTCLSSEAVQSATLSLECVHYIESCHSLSASVLSVSDGISDDVLKENF